jgi:2-aminoadipate transaminase
VNAFLSKILWPVPLSGSVVLLDYNAQKRPTSRRLQRMKAHALSELGHRTEEPPISWLMATALAQPEIISLAAGFTDNESLPVKEVRSLLDEILRSPRTGQAALQYGTTAGDPTLRELTTGHI